MEDLDFAQPAPGGAPARSLYDPTIAMSFFKSAGKVQALAKDETIFVENEKGTKLLMKPDNKMYFILDGDVAIHARGKEVGTLKRGEVFGEMTSITQLPRSATAIAKTPCQLISVDEKQFQKALPQSPEFALMLMNIMLGRLRRVVERTDTVPGAEFMNKSSVFDKKVLADLENQLDTEPIHAPLNQVIMTEGESGVFMYVVLKGRIGIAMKGTVIERIGVGGVFGEMALVDRSARTASAIAEIDCTLLRINRNDMIELMKTNPGFATTLVKCLAERVRYTTSTMREA
jgi:CRP/FNR family transcriptional regulator, cyclic AMP receptor protein